MVFTNVQNTSFFENGPQMHLSAAVRARLAQEGLVSVEDFEDFKEDQLKAAYKNMRTSIPGTAAIAEQADNNGNVIVPAVPAVPAIHPCLVSAKCSLRLAIASTAFHYYVSIGREPNAVNMNYTNVLKTFYVEYEAIMELSKDDKPEVPHLHKNTTPLRWIESFKDTLYRTYGIRKTPLSYVIRDTVEVLPEAEDPLEAGRSYGDKSGSVLDELIARLAHNDPLYKADNATVYSMLEEATRGTVYASTVKPFTRRKDGRSAWMSMLSSHAGVDKWEQLFKERSKFLMNTKWNGRNYSLEKFTGMHRSSFVQLQEASSHVNSQLPTEHTRVGYLIDNLHNTDPDLRAAIGSIRLNTNNMRDSFEDAVACLLPVDPYIKSRRSNDSNVARISDTNALQNKSTSRTGVDFRWHTKEEYAKLNKEQRAELYEYQQKNQEGTRKEKRSSGHQPRQSVQKKLKAKIAKLEAEKKQLQEGKTSDENEPSTAELHACFASVLSSTNATLPPTPAPTPTIDPRVAAATTRLRGILKRKRE